MKLLREELVGNTSPPAVQTGMADKRNQSRPDSQAREAEK